MPRSARLDIPGLLHHVIVRGIEKRSIFLDDQDRHSFFTRFSFLLEETSTDCLAWAFLDNHVHLLLRPRQGKLATFMRRLLTGHAVTFNLRHRRSGHLFQNRYKSYICEEESYLLELVRYIHLNPLRAGVVKNLQELSVYPWCGHAVLLGVRDMKGQCSEEVLTYFGKRKKTSRAKYAAFIAEGVSIDSPEPNNEQCLRLWLAKQIGRDDDLAMDNRVLGGESFAAGLDQKRALPDSRIAVISSKNLMEKVASRYNLAPEKLSQRTRNRAVGEARAVFCYLAVREAGCNGAEIARLLRISRSGVSIAADRGEKIVEKIPELKTIAS